METKHLVYVALAVILVAVVVAADEIASSKLDALHDLLHDDSSSSDDVLTRPEEFGYDLEDTDKRGGLMRYGRGTLFRFGKRGNLFRYGKRGTLFRFGKRQLFRYGKRADEDTEDYGKNYNQDSEQEEKRTLFRYGKRFARDTGKRQQKPHVPFRFGREEDEFMA